MLAPAHEGQLDLLKQQIAKAHKGLARKHIRIGVLAGTGHGDHMRGIAFCQALKRHYDEPHIFLVMHFCGETAMTDIDLGHNAIIGGPRNAFAIAQQVPRRIAVGVLRKCFDVLYDAVPYAIGTYYNPEPTASGLVDHTPMQMEMNERLKPFLDFYLDHPLSGWKWKFEPYSQWDMMSASSGIQVDEEDLIPPFDLADVPKDIAIADMEGKAQNPAELAALLLSKGGSPSWEKAKLKDVPRYIVVHNGTSPLCDIKQAPPDVFKAIISRLKADGIRCVQVGYKDDVHEPKMKDVIDRRGFRLPITTRLISEAIALVDIEGFLPYVARSMNKASVVLFGPTPVHTFVLTESIPLVNQGAAGGMACPVGTCFWGGGFSRAERWAARCPLGEEHNPQYPHCANFMEPAKAAEIVAGAVRDLEVEAVARREGLPVTQKEGVA